jgi:protein-L-isoaspartate(D-aspartate) O-methyltransferase
MVSRQLEARGVVDSAVLAAFRAVPRERFVPHALTSLSYSDSPVDIGSGQTISQPFVIALMLQEARLRPSGRVLEVGAGSGYVAALLARIVARVVAIERLRALADEAKARLDALKITNVVVRVGDGTCGSREDAPFDAIIVSAGGPRVPVVLKDQLVDGGRLVIPVGPAGEQHLLRVERRGDSFRETDLGEVSFVALIGEEGWRERLGA